MVIIKTYGIRKNCKGRYSVTTEISEDKVYYNMSNYQDYAKPEFALMKAEAFIKRCHKDFVNFQGIPIHFEFKNMGLVN